MPTLISEVPAQLDPPEKLWTREECEQLSGLLEGQHFELIEGKLINKMGKKRPHVNSLSLLLEWLIGVFGLPFVQPEAPIDVAPADNPRNEPEPDLTVLKRDRSHFTQSPPQPGDVQLLIEVADSTVGFDLRTKAALYARAGIADYWVLDIPGRRMVVHRDPRDGRYQLVVAYSADESIAPLAAPNSLLRIRDAFLE